MVESELEQEEGGYSNSKLVKQEVNGAVILPPLVFPGLTLFISA
jgi:hypothetical protein